MVIVSKVYSSPSMNSSTLMVGTWRSRGSTARNSSRGFDPVGIGRAGAVDRFQDHRKADLLGGLPAAGNAVDRHMARCADAGLIQRQFHRLLVAKQLRLFDAQARRRRSARAARRPA